MYDFSHRVALITGGTDGIGLAAAMRFAREGANVFMVGRDAARGAQALAALHSHAARVAYFSADVSNSGDVARMVSACVERFGRLDFAVNNAAASFPLVPLAEIPIEAIDESLATDLRGTWCCMKYEIEAMLTTGGGAIVNVSSTNGVAASANAAMYSATKHGVNGLTAAAAREYIARGIRINTVCPGAIETPRRQRRLAGKTTDEIRQHYADLERVIPAGRVARAEEVAAAIVWLCSDEASYVVGQHLIVDGGLTA
jgi:NAD(P)-dependent dehydrogenase (short-subunit alcohol dehydrogenase family)